MSSSFAFVVICADVLLFLLFLEFNEASVCFPFEFLYFLMVMYIANTGRYFYVRRSGVSRGL